MASRPQEGLTEREGEIMNVLWQQEEATVEGIRHRLEADLVPTTIRTLLRIMLRKGYVVSRMEGKAKVFRPLVARETAQTSALETLRKRLFEGSTRKLMLRLMEDEDISIVELERLRREAQGGETKGDGR